MFPHRFITVHKDAATLSQAHLIQRGLGTGGRTPGKILLSRVLTATLVASCRTEVIDPLETRPWLMRALRSVPTSMPKEGKQRPFVDTW
jgi:hypothetical protein